jgi:SulP family sulfate permease
MQPSPAPPRFAELFTPKLVTVLREGYGAAELRADLAAGATVAVVAAPLSMAIAIASGVGPERGLWTAIVGGFLVSALGGSRFQIGGPAGAFIVLVAATAARHGVDGLILATMMSGVMLAAAGFLRLGAYVKFIPYPVTVGFTAGISAIIFASQIAPALGLTLAGPEPGAILDKLPALWAARDTLNPWAAGLAAATAGLILALRRARPRWPGMLIAVALAAVATAALGLPVETVESRFGGLPRGLPAPALPEITAAKMLAVLPDAAAFALLGAIESLLSAVVAYGMTGRRHRSNCELAAQGTANVASALFGGICVTGTIARTATNVRAGAHGPVSGMIHALILLAMLAVAAPLAGAIPLSALAGVLIVVAWTMAERRAFASLLTGPRGDATALVATFLLTVFRDLTEAILVGVAIGALVFIRRMADAAELRAIAEPDRADDAEPREAYVAEDRGVTVLRPRGALFFGAASMFDAVLERLPGAPRALVLDLSDTPFVDASGAHGLARLAAAAAGRGATLYVAGADAAARRALAAAGLRPPVARFAPSVAAARAHIRGAPG